MDDGVTLPDYQRRTVQTVCHPVGKLRQRLRLRQLSVAGDILFAEASALNKVQAHTKLNIVTKLGMRIQWKMIGQQTNVMPKKMCNALLLDTSNGHIFIAPEVAMVH
jgi:hypothetical protein